MTIFERDIAVDMGTSSTLLFEQGKGVVAREPTVVAVDRVTGKIMRVGQDIWKRICQIIPDQMNSRGSHI